MALPAGTMSAGSVSTVRASGVEGAWPRSSSVSLITMLPGGGEVHTGAVDGPPACLGPAD